MQTLTLSDIGLNDSSAAARTARATAEANEMTARHLTLAARASLGFIFLVLGANGFGHFLPHASAPLSGAFLGDLWGALTSPVGSALQLIVGGFLLANRFVSLAVLLAAPLVANLIAAHVVLAHGRASLPLVALVFEAYLLWTHRDALRALFAPLTARSGGEWG